MTTLIFEPSLAGHHLEYLHHIYMGAIEKQSEKFIFAVPHNEWCHLSNNYVWPNASNIQWYRLDDNECNKTEHGSMLMRSYRLARLIKHVAITVHADNILLISLAAAIPFLPLLLPRKIKVSGIIYKIYLRSHKKGIRKLLDYIRYTIMARNASIGTIFILNDPRSAAKLNSIYQTNRFQSLPDPVPQVDYKSLHDMRLEFGLKTDTKVYVHFGAMDERKGTLVILDALCNMTRHQLSNKAFVFAGRISANIHQRFYMLVEKACKNGARIIVRDEFCSYQFLNDICHTADCIIIPYLLTDLSSGALGYAAVHNTPVIGPSTGLIGELIRDNKLGFTLDKCEAAQLVDCILNQSLECYGIDYATQNTIDNFTKKLIQ